MHISQEDKKAVRTVFLFSSTVGYSTLSNLKTVCVLYLQFMFGINNF